MGDPTMRSQTLYRVRTMAKELKERHKKEKKLATSRPIQNLSELLLDKNEMTQLIQFYWNVMESTYRVLHGPTFWSKYRIFCEQPSNTSEDFIAILLLIVACTRCIYTKQQTSYRGLTSVNRDEAITSILACEDWISRQSRKYTSIELVQIRVLLYIAKRMNSYHAKRSWEEAASLLNFALGIGLHRDPMLLEKAIGACSNSDIKKMTSAHEKEMRRRIWATIIELELQAAFDRGFPSSINSLSADCGTPSNIGDEELEEISKQLPFSKTPEFYTANSFLRISSRSFALRSEMNRIINDPKIHLSYDGLLHYHSRTMEELEKMPRWVDTHRRNDNASSVSALPALLLDIQLRQYLLLLHLPYAQHADSKSRYSYSRMVCLNAANTILEHHSKLVASGNFTLNLLRHDVFRSALAMCHSVILWKSVQSK
jgi:hypothetical protein